MEDILIYIFAIPFKIFIYMAVLTPLIAGGAGIIKLITQAYVFIKKFKKGVKSA